MKIKKIIIVNSILLVIALYTFISIYKPSILDFIDSDYVNGKYTPNGGDHLTDGLFLGLFHYLNLLVFYILNTVFIVKAFRRKHTEIIVIAILSIVLMLGLYTWRKNITKTQYQIIETQYQLNE